MNDVVLHRTPAAGLPLVSPDAIEEKGVDHDTADGERARRLPPVVAIGGSAGSIGSMRDFFDATPPSSGLAYAVVLHLSPDHESVLAELLQRHTRMPVRQACDGERIRPDTVFVIPPGKHLTTDGDRFRLTDLESERGKRVAVDLFLRSLADTHGPHVAAIVLSGGDGDGALGLKRVKERGGLTVAQDPGEARDPSMPGNAIDTGMVDWVLPVVEMPARIAAYFARETRGGLSETEPASKTGGDGPDPADPEQLLRAVLAFVRARTGHDFANYKRATIVRRVTRRMQICGVDSLEAYLDVLRTLPGEAGALLQDLLISVTNFFRDRSAFEALEQQVPALFRGKGPNDVVRAWCPGCATGEEAYSIAMLLREHADRLPDPPKLQVFGCDLDEAAVQVARIGLYPATITADVSAERLARFFSKEPGGHRVRRDLRDMVLFAAHDLLQDAPFSRIDLVSCRNLLIYLNHAAQMRVLETIHFATLPDGLLFLGHSESVDDDRPLFEPVDRPNRIYRRVSVEPAGSPSPGVGDGIVRRVLNRHARVRSHSVALAGGVFLATGAGAEPRAAPAVADLDATADALHARLLARLGPASIVIDAVHEVIHLSANVHRYLRMPSGEPTRDIFRLVLPALRADLRVAVLRAAETAAPADLAGRTVELPEGPCTVDLRVVPAGELAPGYLLVLFDERPAPGTPSGDEPSAASAAAPEVVEQLERSLARAAVDLRATVEDHEVTVEELRASNEELQAINEELRSAGEELETSREELQSVNEELTTVNAEFRMHVEQLSRANSDLHNLMSATRIATVFLDRQLQVMRFTPAAAPLFNLIPSDIGRPISDLNGRLDYDGLAEDVRLVLETLAPIERELREGSRWFLARVLPYRTVDDRIAGVVLSFVDITDRRHAETALRESERQYHALFESIDEGFFVIDLIDGDDGTAVDYRFVDVNPAFERHTGISAAVGRLGSEVEPGAWRESLRTHDAVRRSGQPVRGESLHADSGRWFTTFESRVGGDESRRVCVVFDDITERKRRDRRQAFFLRLSDALRPLADADQVTSEACRLLGDELGSDRAYFVELNEERGVARILDDHRRDHLPSLVGEHSIAAYAWSVEAMRSGAPLVIRNAFRSKRVPAADRESMAAIGIAAHVNAPLLKGGALVGALCITQRVPRDWSEAEVDLVVQTAERIWATVERARAQQALHELEARAWLSIEAAAMGTWEWNLQTDEVFWNDRHFELFGLEKRPNPLPTTIFFQHVHPDDRPRIGGLLQAAIAERTVFDAQFRAIREDDEIRWMNGYGRVVEEAAGRPSKMSGVMFDVTDKKRADQSLRDSEARLQSIANVVPDLLWSSEPDGTASWYNERWTVYTGVHPSDGAGWGWADAIDPDEREQSLARYRDAVEHATPLTMEHRLRRADGAYRWHLVRLEPLLDADGKLLRMYGAATDIHDLRVANESIRANEQQVRLSEERLRLIVENARQYAIVAIDLDWRVSSWNSGAEEILLHAADEVMGRRADLLYTEEDVALGAPARERAVALARGSAADERWHQRRDGSRFWGSGSLMAMRDEAGSAVGFVKIFRDQTAEMRAREATEQARDDAEAAGAAKDRFLAVLSHELRTPLTPVLMATQMIGRDKGLPPPLRRSVEIIERNVRLQTHLIDDLLDVTRIASDKMELRRERLSLHELLGRAVEVATADLESRRQRVTMDLGAADDSLDADAKRLQQLFWNLLKNASKFSPEQSEISVVSRNEPGRIVVDVIDTGIGFEPEDAARIFGAFEQANLQVTREFGGLGLGLAIAQAVVAAHHGTIRAASLGPGRGATFTVKLPLESAEG